VPIPVPQVNPISGRIEMVYQTFRADLDETTLKAIASTTNGEYFRATDAVAMSRILDRIDHLEKTRLSAPKSETVDELYAAPLTAALALLGLSLFTGETWLRKVSA